MVRMLNYKGINSIVSTFFVIWNIKSDIYKRLILLKIVFEKRYFSMISRILRIVCRIILNALY